MADTHTDKIGIDIDGDSVEPDDDRLTAIVQGDPTRRQIVDALLATTRRSSYSSSDELDQEVTFRQTLVATMSSFQTGGSDADYFIPNQLNPQIGGTKVVNGAWQIAEWKPIDATDLWSPAWIAQANSTTSGLLSASSIFPYRGECAGAFQICTFMAAYAALHDAVPDVTQLQIGSWKSPVRSYMQTSTVGSDLVPGDYLYFKNKDDYLKWAPGGFWQGLNAMYMGTDALGTKHYSGLGAAWLSEYNLRSIVVNAYTHDCNANTHDCKHQVDDPDTEVRFTLQATMSLPGAPQHSTTDHPEEQNGLMTPAHDALIAAGFTRHPDDPGLYVRAAAPLTDLAGALGFDPTHLRQTPSAPAFGASQHVDLGSARCVVTPVDDHGDATEGDGLVTAFVRLDVNEGTGADE